ncbi:hypothetical protein [Corynebacterium pacaense]|uniref:hypothetical protein n=1 Tax=Corynebacterium pacaense TaxID=1816684 RepID=UPI0009BA6C3C|nr:hypothetical protein [Corynebacterium pacaense]
MSSGWPGHDSTGGWDTPSGTGPDKDRGSYVFGEATEIRRDHMTFGGTNPLWAPWALKVSAGVYLIAAGFLGWWTLDSGLPVIPAVISVVAACTLVTLGYVMLKAQPWARYALSVLSALGILCVVVTDFWPVTLLGILALVFMWMPANSRWFGFH